MRKYNKKITKMIVMNLILIAILLATIIYPLKPEINLKEREVRLRWLAIYKNYTIHIDDNKEFTSPMIIKTERRDYPIKLEPGIYFWKIKAGGISSPTKEIIFNSDVSIKLNNKTLENDGNVNLNISLETPTGAIIMDLPYKEKVKIEDRSNITAKQK